MACPDLCSRCYIYIIPPGNSVSSHQSMSIYAHELWNQASIYWSPTSTSLSPFWDFFLSPRIAGLPAYQTSSLGWRINPSTTSCLTMESHLLPFSSPRVLTSKMAKQSTWLAIPETHHRLFRSVSHTLSVPSPVGSTS